MSGPLVSIIIPTFNRAHLIGETLDSVIAQTYQNWECIVVDDGSTDDTAKVMEAYTAKDSRIQYHHRPPEHKPGGNGARNYGFKMSRGEYVNWFDSDDLMLPNFLEEKIALFDEERVLVITTGYKGNEKCQNLEEFILSQPENLFTQYASWKLEVLTPSVMIRKSFLKDFDLFNEKLYRGQEAELFCRLFYRLSDLQYVIKNDFHFIRRMHNDSILARDRTYNSKFKYSQSYIFLENLKRGLEIKNQIVIQASFQSLVHRYFSGISNSDEETITFIYHGLKPILKQYQKGKFVEFIFINKILKKTERGRVFFKKRWFKFEFK